MMLILLNLLAACDITDHCILLDHQAGLGIASPFYLSARSQKVV